MKCAICGRKIEHTFLNKIKGNYVYKGSKLYVVCSECFKKLQTKEEILKHVRS